MISRVFIVWLALASLSGWLVYQLKYQVQQRETALQRIDQRIAEEQESIRIMHAEWAYLTEPGRLADAARRHLALAPVGAAQLIDWHAVPLRGSRIMPLPPALIAAPAVNQPDPDLAADQPPDLGDAGNSAAAADGPAGADDPTARRP